MVGKMRVLLGGIKAMAVMASPITVGRRYGLVVWSNLCKPGRVEEEGKGEPGKDRAFPSPFMSCHVHLKAILLQVVELPGPSLPGLRLDGVCPLSQNVVLVLGESAWHCCSNKIDSKDLFLFPSQHPTSQPARRATQSDTNPPRCHSQSQFIE